jgi:hypothetical protein
MRFFKVSHTEEDPGQRLFPLLTPSGGSLTAPYRSMPPAVDAAKEIDYEKPVTEV